MQQLGGDGVITGEYNYHIIRVLPYIVVLITALIGFNVSGVLVLGIAMTGIIGLLEGSITFLDWIGAIGVVKECQTCSVSLLLLFLYQV